MYDCTERDPDEETLRYERDLKHLRRRAAHRRAAEQDEIENQEAQEWKCRA